MAKRLVRGNRKKLHTKLSKAPKLRLVKGSGGHEVARKHSALSHTKPVSIDENSALLTSNQQEDLIIKHRMKAQKLGRSILRRWHSRMEVEEVNSIVDLSLCEAVKRFDATKGASFMTFLFYHLKGNLVRAVTAAASATAIPLALAELGDSIFTGCEVQIKGKKIGINAIELAEAVTSQDEPSPDEALWRKELSGKSSSACDKLDTLEREIVRRIFVQEQQIIDIAAALGYSRCHISRVKRKALSTLHDELRIVMNQDDYAAMSNSIHNEEADLANRLTERKEVHRRRPRSGLTKSNAIERSAEAA